MLLWVTIFVILLSELRSPCRAPHFSLKHGSIVLIRLWRGHLLLMTNRFLRWLLVGVKPPIMLPIIRHLLLFLLLLISGRNLRNPILSHLLTQLRHEAIWRIWILLYRGRLTLLWSWVQLWSEHPARVVRYGVSDACTCLAYICWALRCRRRIQFILCRVTTIGITAKYRWRGRTIVIATFTVRDLEFVCWLV